jgi:hypothetical protein
MECGREGSFRRPAKIFQLLIYRRADGPELTTRARFAQEGSMTRINPVNPRTVRRVATAVCVVAAPLLGGAARALVPSVTEGSARQTFAVFQAHLGEARAELAVAVAACLVLPFFVLGLYRLSVRGAPALAGAGCVLALVGWEAVAFIWAGDALMYELAARGGSPVLWSGFMAYPAIRIMTLIFVVGHLTGTALLGIALWRVLAVRPWAAAAIVADDFGHLAAHTIGSRGLDVAAFGLLTAGCAAAARGIVRTPDGEWDLPPRVASVSGRVVGESEHARLGR